MANGKAAISQYFSDLIGDSYKTWKNTKIVMDGGTGTGKTFFNLNILGTYAKEQRKRVLYLCNRKGLKHQIIREVRALGLKETVYVMTYQQLESFINSNTIIGDFDYIIAAECHYSTNDARFNDYTDISYNFLKNQNGNVVTYVSATAKVFFNHLLKEKVSSDHYFNIPKKYDYVKKFYFYQKKALVKKAGDILTQEEDSKIVIFCNAYDRVLELYKVFGDRASYCASKNAKKLQAIINENVIYEHEDGTVTFDKRILITTKVLDNGIDIKDRMVKHIFNEIFDADSAIQAFGRKRPVDADDTCTFYQKLYTKQAIQSMLNTDNNYAKQIDLFKNDYDQFYKIYGNNRRVMQRNPIFYCNFGKNKADGKPDYHHMRYNKYKMDIEIYNDMKKTSYEDVILNLFGHDIRSKAEWLDIYINEKDEFLDYLHTLEERWLFAEDRKELVKWFETIGVKLRRAGINTLNGALQDYYGNKYKFRFRNKQLDENGKLTKKNLVDKRRTLPDGSENLNRNKTYWVLEEIN